MSLYSSELEILVPFYDLDPMNVVWHGNYVKYMEKARCDMFSKLGYTYIDMKNDSFAYPIAKMNTKYIKPASFEQKLLIKTFLNEIEPAINIKYEIFDKISGEKIFAANTMQIAVNIKTMQSEYKPPKRLVEILRKINE